MNFTNYLADLVQRIKELPPKQSNIIIVLQVIESLLSQAIQFQLNLKKQISNNCNIYLLCDTNKSPCCTDIIGALHLGDYDLLVHFGQACFSEDINQKHIYYFDKPQTQINYKELKQKIEELNIDTIIAHQSIIQDTIKLFQGSKIQVLKLPIHSSKGDHFALSYYKNVQPQSLILVGFNEQQQSRFSLMKQSLKIQKLFSGRTYQQIVLSSKALMKRFFLINKIKQCNIFGILVKNANTKYCQDAIEYCKRILTANDKKSYIFMMNNLNEVKLGNFPQIEAYIIVSCHNFSLYNQSDMYKLVVTPFDVNAAFSSETNPYQFDLNNLDLESIPKQIKQQIKQTTTNQLQNSLMKQQTQLQVQKIFQTLDYYKQRQYKGIDYSEQKQIKKMTKGKIGIAAEYKKLQ